MAGERSSLLTRLQAGAANLLEWSPAEKCLLVDLIVLTFVARYAGAEFYVLAHPDVAPYLDRVVLGVSLKVHLVEIV
jgi:hypothetical protein